jgi:hypothetical protein
MAKYAIIKFYLKLAGFGKSEGQRNRAARGPAKPSPIAIRKFKISRVRPWTTLPGRRKDDWRWSVLIESSNGLGARALTHAPEEPGWRPWPRSAAKSARGAALKAFYATIHA